MTSIMDSELLCPTFTSYTSDQSAETATRVAATSPYLEDEDSDFEFDLPVPSHVYLDAVPAFNCESFLEDHGRHVNDDVVSTSSGSDGLESVPVWTYCMWQPRKSKSTGSGLKRWKLLNLLGRTKSDGKGNLVFLAAPNKTNRKDNFIFLTPNKTEATVRSKTETFAVKSKSKVSAVEEFYVQNRASKEGQKRKSYLPYKKELVGFFKLM